MVYKEDSNGCPDEDSVVVLDVVSVVVKDEVVVVVGTVVSSLVEMVDVGVFPVGGLTVDIVVDGHVEVLPNVNCCPMSVWESLGLLYTSHSDYLQSCKSYPRNITEKLVSGTELILTLSILLDRYISAYRDNCL